MAKEAGYVYILTNYSFKEDLRHSRKWTNWNS